MPAWTAMKKSGSNVAVTRMLGHSVGRGALVGIHESGALARGVQGTGVLEGGARAALKEKESMTRGRESDGGGGIRAKTQSGRDEGVDMGGGKNVRQSGRLTSQSSERKRAVTMAEDMTVG